MEESSNKVLFIIAGIVMTLLVITFAFSLVNSSLSKGNELNNQASAKMDSMLESQYTQYDAATISGSQVLNIISEFYNSTEPVYVQVDTLAGPVVTYVCDATSLDKFASATQGTLVQNAKDKANTAYITPTGNFVGAVQRNANDAIIGIVFTQS